MTLPLGLHFGLSNEAYQEDEGLGSGDHKSLLMQPVRWQFNRLKALREALGLGDKPDEGESLAKTFGSAVHVVTLEGIEAFEERYALAEDPPDDILATREAIREALPASVYLPSGAKLYDHEVQAKRHGLGPRLLSEWKIARLIANEGKIEISRRWEATMRLINRVLDAPRPDRDGKSIREVVLTDGYPEVSIFWIDEETGVRLKARFDWLRPRAIVDLKTHGVKDDAETIDSFVGSVRRYFYDLQAAHYIDAFAQISAALAAGQVYGEVDEGWLKRLAKGATKTPNWIWLAVQTIGMPEVDEIQFDAQAIMTAAFQQVRAARGNYVAYRDRFGLDDLWVSQRGRVILEDASFPAAATMSSRAMDRWKIV